MRFEEQNKTKQNKTKQTKKELTNCKEGEIDSKINYF
jgi:hypothetical protein